MLAVDLGEDHSPGRLLTVGHGHLAHHTVPLHYQPMHVEAPLTGAGRILGLHGGEVSSPDDALADDQLEQFVERGWTLLCHAFFSSVAEAVQGKRGRRIGVDLERPECWTRPRVWLKELLCEPPFTDALTDRFASAVDPVVGPNHGTRPRLMAQPAFSMTEPMRTEGGGLFPVEISLAHSRPSETEGR